MKDNILNDMTLGTNTPKVNPLDYPSDKCSKCGNLYDECTDYCPFCGSPMYTMTLEQYKKYVRDQANDIYTSVQ